VLVTNVQDFPAAEIVERYKALADIERGFRVLKSDLEIAPVYHRLPDRIKAHALICFMALVLYRVMRMRLREHGSAVSPKTALEILRRIQQHKATVGTKEYTGISKTTQVQLDLFAALHITAPT
jgi:transposase